jgi:phosphonate transport system substrate-binding protein
MIALLRCFIPVVAAICAAFGGSSSASPALLFGVLNQQSPALTAERWNPILHHVSAVSGIPLRLKMGATVQETDAMMGRSEFDFMFTNHNFQSQYDAIGYKVIARWAGEPIRGVLAVPVDSPIQQLRDLEGKRVAFPSPDAFVAYAVPLVALKKAGVRVEETFAGNQEGTLAQLKAKRVDAGAVNSRFLSDYSERENVRFRTIFVSDGYPDLAVVAHPRVPAETVERVRAALLGMKEDAKAAPILARIKFKGFDAATDRDYDGVRRIYRLIGQ